MYLEPFHHSIDSQTAFAKLSGDFNPIHLDPIFARRTIFGKVVTHGIHNLLCGLEIFLRTQFFYIKRIAVTFKNPVFLNETVNVVICKNSQSTYAFKLICNNINTAEIQLHGDPNLLPIPHCSISTVNFTRLPQNRELHDIKKAQGSIELAGNEKGIQDAFPLSTEALGIDGVARLLGITRLVGMQCPGLNSLFSNLSLSFSQKRSHDPTKYKVIKIDERISLITMSIIGGGIKGTLNAFFRPPIVIQQKINDVTQFVKDKPFKKMRALIIGGSRGLGEISAKIIAVGGGSIIITYLTGEEDAKKVAKEIIDSGNTCKILQMDVSKPQKPIESIIKENWQPTHILYFATPHITSRPSDYKQKELNNVYSDALEKIVRIFASSSSNRLKLFYPSSIYVKNPTVNLVDYASAKIKGEKTAKKLEQELPNLDVIIERLPPLATDQSVSLLNVDLATPLETMVRILTKKL